MTGNRTPRPRSLGEKREFDNAFFIVLIGVFFSCAVPWYFQITQLDLGGFARALFVVSVGYAAMTILVERIRSEGGLRYGVLVLQTLAYLATAVLWHWAGGIENPLYLSFFIVLITLTAQFHGVIRSTALAATGLTASALVAVATSPDLGWYLARFGIPLVSLSRAPAEGRQTAVIAGGVTAPAATIFALVAALTVGVVAIGLSVRAARRLRHASAVTLAAGGTPFLSQAATPTVVVDSSEGTVVACSRSFLRQMLVDGDPEGRPIRELIDLDRVSDLDSLLTRGGERRHAHYEVRGERRTGSILANRVELTGAQNVIVSFEERIVTGPLEELEEGSASPLVIIGDDDLVRYSNRAARSRLGVEEGVRAEQVLGPLGEGRWWATENRQGSLVLDGKRYRAAVSRAASCDALEDGWAVRLVASDE